MLAGDRGFLLAYGLLTLALLPALSEQIYHVSGYSSGYSYGYDKVRFTRPLKSGSHLRLRLTLSEVARKGAGTMVTVACVMEIQGEAAPALVTDWRSLYFPPA
jgi:acyl dehydratase